MLHAHSGRSLIELLICMAILAILLSQGISSYSTFRQRQHLIGAAQASYFFFQQARSETIKNNVFVYVNINPTGNGCLGLSEQTSCQCNLAHSCYISQQRHVLDYSDYPDITMTNVTFGPPLQSRFMPPRGMATGFAGSFQLTNGTHILKVILSNAGRVRICALTPPFSPYKTC